MPGIRTLRSVAAAGFCAATVLAATGPGPAAAAAPPADCYTSVATPKLSSQQADRIPWSQQRLGLDADGVWTVTRGAGIKVAVIDTGVDAQNPALAGAVEAGVSVTGDTEPGNYDCDGHGTGVAGVIAGRPGALFRFAGVAPAATIIPIRQTYHSGRSDAGGEHKLALGIERAIALGAKVVNISIVSGLDTQDLDDAVKDAQAHDIVIVASAGNDDDAGAKYPASIPGVLSVGAIKQDGSGTRFSEKAAGALVAAPGEAVMVPTTYYRGSLTLEQGTSFAAPYVAGTAALVRAAHPELKYWQVIQRIQATADRPSSGQAFDPVVGWGVVNPYRAVTAVLPDEQNETGPGTAPSAPARVGLPQPGPGSGDGRGAALGWGVLGAALAGVAVPLTATALRRGRARGWRAGG